MAWIFPTTNPSATGSTGSNLQSQAIAAGITNISTLPWQAQIEVILSNLLQNGAPSVQSDASSLRKVVKSVTGIGDNTSTTVLTITVPNAAHAANVLVTIVGMAGAGGAIGAFECVTSVSYNISVARTVGVAVGATASTAFGSAASVVAGAGTMTCVAAVALTGEGVTVANTVAVNATINHSGASTAHTALIIAEIVNSQSTGVTLS